MKIGFTGVILLSSVLNFSFCGSKSSHTKKTKEALMRSDNSLDGVTLLGQNQTQYQDTYHPDVLETFQNLHPNNDYLVKFICPEFTSLCPITGQPDFATIHIAYVPNELMVESKSLKLYLFSFRNQGDFHEDCVNIIMKDLVKLMQPKYLEVTGVFTPRGGIAIHPYANYGEKGSLWEGRAAERLLTQAFNASV